MNKYAIEQYFGLYPHLEECFETPEGVLHPIKSEADRWVRNMANKTIVTHKNPAKKTEVEDLTEPVEENDVVTKHAAIANVKTEIDFINESIKAFQKKHEGKTLNAKQNKAFEKLNEDLKAKQDELAALEK